MQKLFWGRRILHTVLFLWCHMIRKSCSVTRRTSSRQDILRHINAHYDLELVEDSPEWVYAMRHFKDGPLSLTPN